MQILPGMSDILGTLPSVNPRVQQPCLQFTYWSVVFMEQTVQGSQVFRDSSCYTYVKCVYSRISCAHFREYILLARHCTRGAWLHHPFFILTRVIFFIYTKKKLLSDRCKPVQLPLPCFFLFFSYHYSWVYVKSSWSSLHAVMMSLWDFSFLCFTQRTALASTLRHIGEELYKPQVKCLIICWYRPLNSPYAVTVSVFHSHQPLLALQALYRLLTGAFSLPFCFYFVYCFLLRPRIQVLLLLLKKRFS